MSYREQSPVGSIRTTCSQARTAITSATAIRAKQRPDPGLAVVDLSLALDPAQADERLKRASAPSTILQHIVIVCIAMTWQEYHLGFLKERISHMGGRLVTAPEDAHELEQYLIIPTAHEEDPPSSGIGERIRVGAEGALARFAHMPRVSTEWLRLCHAQCRLLSPTDPPPNMISAGGHARVSTQRNDATADGNLDADNTDEDDVARLASHDEHAERIVGMFGLETVVLAPKSTNRHREYLQVKGSDRDRFQFTLEKMMWFFDPDTKENHPKMFKNYNCTVFYEWMDRLLGIPHPAGVPRHLPVEHPPPPGPHPTADFPVLGPRAAKSRYWVGKTYRTLFRQICPNFAHFAQGGRDTTRAKTSGKAKSETEESAESEGRQRGQSWVSEGAERRTTSEAGTDRSAGTESQQSKTARRTRSPTPTLMAWSTAQKDVSPDEPTPEISTAPDYDSTLPQVDVSADTVPSIGTTTLDDGMRSAPPPTTGIDVEVESGNDNVASSGHDGAIDSRSSTALDSQTTRWEMNNPQISTMLATMSEWYKANPYDIPEEDEDDDEDVPVDDDNQVVDGRVDAGYGEDAPQEEVEQSVGATDQSTAGQARPNSAADTTRHKRSRDSLSPSPSSSPTPQSRIRQSSRSTQPAGVSALYPTLRDRGVKTPGNVHVDGPGKTGAPRGTATEAEVPSASMRMMKRQRRPDGV